MLNQADTGDAESSSLSSTPRNSCPHNTERGDDSERALDGTEAVKRAILALLRYDADFRADVKKLLAED